MIYPIFGRQFFIESETILIWKFKRNKTMTKEDSTRHHKESLKQHHIGKRLNITLLGKTRINLTNWRHDNWKRLNRIKMVHRLAKVFTWIKSLKHILFIHSCLFAFISRILAWRSPHHQSNLESHAST